MSALIRDVIKRRDSVNFGVKSARDPAELKDNALRKCRAYAGGPSRAASINLMGKLTSLKTAVSESRYESFNEIGMPL